MKSITVAVTIGVALCLSGLAACGGGDDSSACVDFDGDGYGVGETCDGTDHNELDPSSYMGATERCDGVDNDGDGQVDEGFAELGTPCDGPDGDLCAYGIVRCNASGDGVECGPEALEDVVEVCDGVDNDCDGDIDEELGTVSCGRGACQHPVSRCTDGQPQACDPWLGASVEVCDGVDNDCDGAPDEELGTVSCGVGACARMVPRCDGGQVQTCIPGVSATEVCDGTDNDCDGDIDEELGTVSCGVGACARVVPLCDGGQVQTCTPGVGATEVCDGTDNDCDGATDEELGTVTCGMGACANEVPACLGGVPQLCTPHAPTAEVCDGVDNDCDSGVDNTGFCGATDGGDGDPFEVEGYFVETDSVGLDGMGDVILKKSLSDYHFIWLPAYNVTVDGAPRGVVIKFDTVEHVEVARYLSFTCSNASPSYASCLDTQGAAVATVDNITNALTLDAQGDAWIAHAPGVGQSSVTKIAATTARCVDRNGNGTIETSHDADGDGSIDLTNPTEFPGLADECVLFTVNVGAANDRVKALAVDGQGQAWLGAYYNPGYEIHRVAADGSTVDTVAQNLPQPFFTMAIDRHSILWGTSSNGLYYLDTFQPATRGTISNPDSGADDHDGIAVDGNQHLWLTGWDTGYVYRYQPNRNNGVPTGTGQWTTVNHDLGAALGNADGIAVDHRGMVWVAHHSGDVSRFPMAAVQSGSPSATVNASNGLVTLDAGGVTSQHVTLDIFGHLWILNPNPGLLTRYPVSDMGDPNAANLLSIQLPGHQSLDTWNNGYGLLNFIIDYPSQGHYRVLLEPCQWPAVTHFLSATWASTTPSGTDVQLRVRTADDAATLPGQTQVGPWASGPVDLDAALSGAPARYLELEFELQSDQQDTPTLEDYSVTWECVQP